MNTIFLLSSSKISKSTNPIIKKALESRKKQKMESLMARVMAGKHSHVISSYVTYIKEINKEMEQERAKQSVKHKRESGMHLYYQVKAVNTLIMRVIERQYKFLTVFTTPAQEKKISDIIETALKGLQAFGLITTNVMIGTKFNKDQLHRRRFGEFTLSVCDAQASKFFDKLHVEVLRRTKYTRHGYVASLFDTFVPAKVQKAADTISGCGPKFTNAASDLASSAAGIASSLADIASACTSVKSAITYIKETFMEWARTLQGKMKEIVLAIASTIATCFIAPDHWQKLVAIRAAEMMASVCDLEKSHIVEKFIEAGVWFKDVASNVLGSRSESPEPEFTDATYEEHAAAFDAFLEDSDSIPLDMEKFRMIFNFGSTILVLLTTYSVIDAPDILSTNDLMTTLTNMVKTVSGRVREFNSFKSLITSLSDWATSASQWIYDYFTGNIAAKQIADCSEEVVGWIRSSELIRKNDITAWMKANGLKPVKGATSVNSLPSKYRAMYDRKVEHLYIRGSYLAAKLKKQGKPALPALQMVNEHMIWFRTQHAKCARKADAKMRGRRVAPACVVICGPAGRGKTQFTTLLQVLHFHTSGLRTPEELDYALNHEVYAHGMNEFFNGYTGQTVAVFDDAGQAITSSSNPDPLYDQLIRLVNENPCNLRMAALDEKNMHFTSELVLITTNAKFNGAGQITCQEALARRVNFRIFLDVDHDVLNAKGVIDPDKVMKKYGVVRTPDIYRLTLEDPMNGSTYADKKPKHPLKEIKIGSETIPLKREMTFNEFSKLYLKLYLANIESKAESETAAAALGEHLRETQFAVAETRPTVSEDIIAMVASKKASKTEQENQTETEEIQEEEEEREEGEYEQHSYKGNTTWRNEAYRNDSPPDGICPLGMSCPNVLCSRAHYDGINTVGEVAIMYTQQYLSEEQRCFVAHGGRVYFSWKPDDLKHFTEAVKNNRTIIEPGDEYRYIQSHLNLLVDEDPDFMTEEISEAFGKARLMETDVDHFVTWLKDNGYTHPLWLTSSEVYDRSPLANVTRSILAGARELKDKAVKWMTDNQIPQMLTILGTVFSAVVGLCALYRYVFKEKEEAPVVCCKGRCDAECPNFKNNARVVQHVMTQSQKRRQKEEKAKIFNMFERARAATSSALIVPDDLPGHYKDVACNPIPKVEKTLNAIKNNTYAIMRGKYEHGSCEGVSDPVLVGHCMFVRDRAVIMPNHVFAMIKGAFGRDEVLLLRNEGRVTGKRICKEDILSHTQLKYGDAYTDLCLVHFSKYCIDMHMDLTEFIPEGIKQENYRYTVYRLIQSEPDYNTTVVNVTVATPSQASVKGEPARYYRLMHPGEPGDSGAPCMTVPIKEDLKPVIDCIYTGATDMVGPDGQNYGYGVAIPLRKAVIMPILQRMRSPDGLPMVKWCVPELDPPTYNKDHYEGDFAHIGTYPKRIHKGGETSLVKTPWHAEIAEPTKAPAPLKPFVNKNGKKIHPMRNAIKKVGKASHNIDRKLLAQVVEASVARLAQISYRAKNDKVYSMEVAVYGELESQFINGIESSSSCGHIGRAKFIELYGSEEAKKGVNNGSYKEKKDSDILKDATKNVCVILAEFYDDFLDAYKKGERLFLPWEDNLKDEKRTFEKCEEGKTRMFSSVSDICSLVVMRMYTLGFAASVMESRIDNGSGVGINVYGHDWDRTLAACERFGKCNSWDGDFRNFDNSHNEDMDLLIGDMIDKYFYKLATDEERQIRKLLWYEIVQSIHINGADVYTWKSGMPSGNSLTTLLNNIVNDCAMRLSWVHVWTKHGDLDMASMANYDKYVYHLTYGDDSITSAHDDVKETFNQISVMDAMPHYGFEYTDASKGAKTIKPYKSMSEIQFLKRYWVHNPDFDYWMCPIEKETIEGMTQYVPKCADVNQAALENVRNAVREAALHDAEYFESFKAKCVKACSRLFGDEDMNFPVSQNMARQRIRYGGRTRHIEEAFLC